MKTIIFSMFFAVSLCSGFAQPIPPDSLYLGQTPPYGTAKIFASGRLASSGNWAGERIAISSDNKEIYYSEITGGWGLPNSSTRIKYYKFYNNTWNGPFILFENYYGPTFSTEGNIMYFHGGGNYDIWYSTRSKNGWDVPALLGKGLYYYQVTNPGNEYVGSIDSIGGVGDWDVCQMKDKKIRSLGKPLNSSSNDVEFFIAKDESFIITSKNESSNNRDLYISLRQPDKTWTNPVELITSKNDSLAFRWGPYVTSDNKYLFYTRGTSSKSTYLYWMRFDNLLDSLKQVTNFTLGKNNTKQ